MQKYLTLLLSLLLINGYSQGTKSYFKESDFWNKVEVKLAEDVKARMVLISDVQIENINSLHAVYFNSDTLPDFIYDHGGFVEFFYNSNDQLISIGRDEGLIIGLQQNKPWEVTTAHFVKKDCCNNGDGYYQQWLVMPDSGGMSLKKLEKVFYAMDTEIPDYFNINLEFRTSANVALQNNPAHYDINKKAVEYQPGARGFAFSSKSDSKGRIWWFVLMSPDPKVDMGKSRMGWMPSKGLQVVRN